MRKKVWSKPECSRVALVPAEAAGGQGGGGGCGNCKTSSSTGGPHQQATCKVIGFCKAVTS